jgi:hypothetical protein
MIFDKQQKNYLQNIPILSPFSAYFSGKVGCLRLSAMSAGKINICSSLVHQAVKAQPPQFISYIPPGCFLIFSRKLRGFIYPLHL